MKKTVLVAAFFAVFVTTIALSQDSPYKGQEGREIKALSQGEIEGYLDARGMGFAKVAELNHYPGPKHVLELSDQLELPERQRLAAKTSFLRMHADASALGEQLVEKEQGLDSLFAEGEASGDNVPDLIAEIARIRGEIRYAHIRAHIEMRSILTADQIERYDDLRGYTSR
jgi:Spy/CpxP family protein refolding chaperone